MKETANAIPRKVRSSMVRLLQARLADSIDAASQAKHAHWNVQGPSFMALHELFETAAAQISGHADEVAERLVALGGTAEGTVRRVVKLTALPEFPPGLVSGMEHVKALAAVLSRLAEGYRGAIDQAEQAGDKVTADLMTQTTGEVDKLVWLIDSHRRARE